MHFIHAFRGRGAVARALTLAAVSVVMAAPAPVAAAVDLLERPALASAKAARALLLGVARAGGRLVAVGEHGIIVWSGDQGRTWQQASVPVSVTLTAVHFPSPEVGWAVGHDGVVLASTDGGATWSKRFDGNRANELVVAEAEARVKAQQGGEGAARERAENALDDAMAGARFGPSRPLLGVWFRDRDHGMVVGAFGQVFRTGDGGRTWQSLGARLDNPDGLHCNAVSAAPDGAVLIAGEGGRVYRSRDGGDTWDTLETGGRGALYGVVGLPGGGGLLAHGFGGRVLRGDGATWVATAIPGFKAVVGMVPAPDGGWLAVDATGARALSTDGGRTFRPLPDDRRGAVAGVATADGETLVVVGVGGARALPLSLKAR